MFAPEMVIGSNQWQFRDIQEMAHYGSTSPVLLDADASKHGGMLTVIRLLTH